MRKSVWLMCLVLVLAFCLPVQSWAGEMALVDVSSTAVRWDLQGGDFEKVVLTVSLPSGNVIRREINGGQPVVFEVDTAAKDGVYTYELRGLPRLDASVRKELAAARKAGNEAEVIQRLQDAGRLPREAPVQSGVFSVLGGAILSPDLREEGPQRRSAALPRQTTGNSVQVITAADEVIPDDLIVQGYLCVGLGCVEDESFGLDTIRLKDINLRIKFEDVSTTAGFPSNDWQLTANDSTSGGANKFSVEDITGSKVPFTIMAGAATNSVFVDSTGRVGIGTATPSNSLHVLSSGSGSDAGKVLIQNTSGTSAARELLEVRNANGAAQIVLEDVAQTPRWVMTGSNAWNIDNTANTGVELQVNPDGAVGIGTGSPAEALHVSGSDGDTTIKVTETSGTGAGRILLDLENNGQVQFRIKDTAQTPTWQLTASNAFQIDNTADVGVELQVDPDGTLRVNGTAMTVPDYVFDPTYELMPLSDLEAFVREERHLPNVPNAEEIKREGLKLTHFPIQLLEKVEELALYAIEQHKQIEGLAAENSELKARLTALEEQVKSN